MTNQEILQKAIQKAVEGGWNIPIGVPESFVPTFKVLPKAHLILFNYTNPDASPYDLEKPGVGSFTTATETVIFNHEFARALWGEEEVDLSFDGQAIKTSGGDNIRCYKWQYYLQQMVISDDPIRYLGEHI